MIPSAQLNNFFRRVWNGFTQTGTGDQVAAEQGTNMEGLAKSYGLGKTNPDGSFSLNSLKTTKRSCDWPKNFSGGYAERFNMHELDRAPTVIGKAIGLLKDGYARVMGLHFTNDQAFRFLRDAWRSTSPTRSPEVNTASLARRIIRNYEPPEFERTRANDPATRDIADAARAVAVGGPKPDANGRPFTAGDVIASSDRVSAYAAATGRVIDYGRLVQQSADSVPHGADAEHDIFIGPTGPITLPRSRGRMGRMGRMGQGSNRRVQGSPWALQLRESYLQRTQLANELFAVGTHLEGFTGEPNRGEWSIVTTQSRVLNFRPAEPFEIATYMAGRGFHPVDENTYFEPQGTSLSARPAVATSSLTGILAASMPWTSIRTSSRRPLSEILG